jgi:hypothetical protein
VPRLQHLRQPVRPLLPLLRKSTLVQFWMASLPNHLSSLIGKDQLLI